MTLKPQTKVLVGVMLSLMFVFSSIGYAALTTTLNIVGSANAAPPIGIYITAVSSNNDGEGATSNSAEHLVHTTNLATNITKTSSSSGWRASAGTVSYTITVWNNTPYVYTYGGTEASTNSEVVNVYPGNSSFGTSNSRRISVSTSGLTTGQSIQPDQRITFTATYTLGKNLTQYQEFKTLVNFKFGIDAGSVGAVAIDPILKTFKDILNDTSDGGGYSVLTDKIDDKYNGADWTANFIGNVSAASTSGYSQDTEVIKNLFGEENMKMTIGGTEVEVKMIIKRENVDNDLETGDSYTATYINNSVTAEGCEMTLYMTTADLKADTRATVYAATFTATKNDDGTYTWYMIGDVYEGTASGVGYMGGSSDGSFDTGTWRSTAKTYTVTDSSEYGYSYSVAGGAEIASVIQSTDENAEKTMLSLLKRADYIIDSVIPNGSAQGPLVGEAVDAIKAAFADASMYYTIAENGTISLKAGVTRAELVPCIKSLDVAVAAFASYT